MSKAIEDEEAFFKEFDENYSKNYQSVNEHPLEDLDKCTPEILHLYLAEKKDYHWFFDKLKEELQPIQDISGLIETIKNFISSNKELLIEWVKKEKPRFYDVNKNTLKVDSRGVTLLEKDLLNLVSFKEISRFFLTRADKVIKEKDPLAFNRFAYLKSKYQKNPCFFQTKRKENELILEKNKKSK